MIASIIIFVLVLSILVLVHELGHFTAAKRAGLLVEEFGFGIPPRVFGKKIGETIYSINALPFGGFVRLHGENTDDNVTNPKRAFITQSKKIKTIIITAGVAMNFILAIVAFAVTYSFLGIPRETKEVKILEVAEGSPAQKAGIMGSDVVVMVNNVSVATNDDFISEIDKYLDSEVGLQIKREGLSELISVQLTPRKNPPEGEGSLGVVISTSETYFPPLYKRIPLGIYHGFKDAIFWSMLILGGLVSMIKGLFGGVIPKDIAGPVGIYALTSQAASFGILSLINFVGILSVNLAILNILPFPALDGGRLLFIGIESVFGKKVAPKIESVIHMVGMAILLLMLFAVTIGDIRKLIIGGGIKGFLEASGM